MPAKVMVVSYNNIGHLPVGRFEHDNAVAYSAEWGFEEFADAGMLAVMTGSPAVLGSVVDASQEAAESALSGLEARLANDLPSVEVVYVYVGQTAMDAAMKFIRKLQSLGKTVHMIACDCNQRTKVNFAKTLGIDIIWTVCGGEDKCGEIFEQYSALVPTT